MTPDLVSEPSGDTPAGAPDAEVELTPVMIAAGKSELLAYNSDYESAEDAVRRIFKAMMEAASPSVRRSA